MTTISKIEAAERNLKEAIRLFFEGRDAVAIHTLASAAQSVLRDIAQHRGLEHTSILHDNPLIATDSATKKRWIKAINAPRNFFKHADKDPTSNFDFNDSENVHVLLDAVLISGVVSPFPLHEANVFLGWFTTENPRMRSAVSGNVIGEFCVRNKISPADFQWFRECLDSKLLIEPL
ncbi:hypothetical protein [Collimonas silvisoli]|uniref:hypothetical protein n=1 Tax=Collimonas silvisoli TaxID=2825884 RepID=UPI001B8CB7FA|nr:hypothetical protein [Collimonas silvisoli]